MSALLGTDPRAELDTVGGEPAALRWAGRVWRVSDSPTPIDDLFAAPPTHPLPVDGWRFQGTSATDGETLVFDVVRCGGAWRVVHLYR